MPDRAVPLNFSESVAARLESDEEARHYLEALAEVLLGPARIERDGMTDDERFAFHHTERSKGEMLIWGGLMVLQKDSLEHDFPLPAPWLSRKRGI
jgi:hypothetical protein